MDGGAGQEEGVEVGDAVMEVDGEPVEQLAGFTVIRGPVGSSVQLSIERGRASAAELVARVKRKAGRLWWYAGSPARASFP